MKDIERLRGWEYDLWEIIDFGVGDSWLIGVQYSPSLEDMPVVVLQQFEDVAGSIEPGEEWKGVETLIAGVPDSIETGVIWIQVDQLPELISKLQATLKTFQETAASEKARGMRANWGRLGREQP